MTKIILSFESSYDIISITLLKNNIVSYVECYGKFITSKYILKFIKYILLKNNLSINNINALLIGGDFSEFTGIRILLSVIYSLSLSYNIPIFKINSMQAICLEIINMNITKYIFIIINFKNNFFFVNLYCNISGKLIVILKYIQIHIYEYIYFKNILFCFINLIYFNHFKNIHNIIYILPKSLYFNLIFYNKTILQHIINPNYINIYYLNKLNYSKYT